jgi:hypothetical protein
MGVLYIKNENRNVQYKTKLYLLVEFKEVDGKQGRNDGESKMLLIVLINISITCNI